MERDEKDFFYQATLKICGRLNIQKSLWHLFNYVKNNLPISRLELKFYEKGLGAFRIIASITNKGVEKSDLILPMSDESRKIIKHEKSTFDYVKIINRPELDPLAGSLVRSFKLSETSSLLIMPLKIEGRKLGVLTVEAEGRDRYTKKHAHLLSLLREPVAIALSNALRYQEVLRLKETLDDDNRYLHQELMRISGDTIIGLDSGLKGIKEKIFQVAPLDTPVLIVGETGVGKEVVANTIQQLSPRKDGPFVKVNCGAIPESLVDSELFGHEKGAFTGAVSQKRGRFERANHGTIFLDEIGELSQEVQVRLLRVIQDKEIERVGGTRTLSLDIRIIAASNRDLGKMVDSGEFREDLFFRLNVCPITIPSLRERKEDIPALVDYFITKKAKEMKIRTPPVLAPGAIEILMAYNWPGNVRELVNQIERALISNINGTLRFDHLFQEHQDYIENNKDPDLDELNNDDLLKLDVVNSQHIQKILKLTHGRIHGPKGAASILGINPLTLRSRMDRLGIPYRKERNNGT
jgi:transcriptional regulator with GAF, ATPase, and Fis domain